ncbi:60S ribosomal protein L22 [Nadsonia fulvescens var. elongata DSM 6958]|uniref:60S ribosomal protein L22 n=1 Tax=Nadsonia fulvescens var. elongata DSM 6958 TaxID=857566 RepID=A0A1E3PDN4_9ASCO|nr:60S ribosomal protein L22 [Nadsonia fulvescens var. elongata DSM 6958]
MAPTRSSKASKTANKYTIDVSAAANDNIFDAAAFEKYLTERIKVDGRTGLLADVITVSREGDSKIIITSRTKFSGKYLKYLTKKYLKKNSLRDWLRVVSVSRGNYELRFFNVSVSDDEEAADDEE